MKINELAPWVAEVIKALPVVEQSVYDFTKISDFSLGEKELEILETNLQIEIKMDDLIVDVAQRLKIQVTKRCE